MTMLNPYLNHLTHVFADIFDGLDKGWAPSQKWRF